MYIVKRQQEHSVKIGNKVIQHTEEYKQVFLEKDFIPIISYLSDKGLSIKIPSIIDGWDATFIYNKLSEADMGKPANDLCLFIYMRLDRRHPIWVEYKNLFSF
jgi:hypothetical protein